MECVFKGVKLGLAGAALVYLSGCAAINQKENLSQFNQSVATGDLTKASELAAKNSGYDPETNQIDDLLWGLQSGMTYLQIGETQKAIDVLDATESLMKQEDLESTLKNGAELSGALLTNEAELAYEQSHYDGVMLNTIKAWSFIAQDDYANARVELNRAEDRQRRAVDYFNKEIQEQSKEENAEMRGVVDRSVSAKETQVALKRAGINLGKWEPYDGYVNPFTTYSYGLNYLLNGKTKADFQKAAQSFERVVDLTGSTMVMKDLELAVALMDGTSRIDDRVWLIFENGQSVIKEEKRVDIPLFLVTDKVRYTGMALPRLKERGEAYPMIAIDGQQSEMVSDIDKIIAAEYDKTFPIILSRQIASMAVKTAAEVGLDSQNEWLGLGASLYNIAMNSADIRSFSALPSQIHTAQVKKTGNSVNLSIGNQIYNVTLDERSSKHVVHVKVPQKGTAPLINVINL